MLTFNLLSDGAPARIRTADLLITNQLLYQLSYKGMHRYINQKSYFAILIQNNNL